MIEAFSSFWFIVYGIRDCWISKQMLHSGQPELSAAAAAVIALCVLHSALRSSTQLPRLAI